MKTIQITNKTRSEGIIIKAVYCQSFWSRFRGLMFRKSIQPDEGLILVQPGESRTNASIHMLFMNFDIAAIWIDKHLKVVDAQLANKWRLAYFPSAPATYILETHVSRIQDFRVGDQLIFEDL